MNILALDCAVSKFSIGVETEKGKIFTTFDIGMRQSEMIVPALQNALSLAGINVSELNYSAVTIGPGSFTGLRLGLSALKALTFAYNIPCFGLSSLKVYAEPFLQTGKNVISCIDANKGKFYSSIFNNTKVLLKDDDYPVENIISKISEFADNEEFWILGPDNKKLYELLCAQDKTHKFFAPEFSFNTSESLIRLVEKMIENNEKPLEDYDGPVYLRASEAELKLNNG